MNKFHENFKKLIKESGVKQAKLAEILGLTPQAFSYYANGREPSFDLLIKISRHFNVTIDYLLGMTEIKNYDDVINRGGQYLKCKCGRQCYKFPDEYLCQICNYNEIIELCKQYVTNLLEANNGHIRRDVKGHRGGVEDERLSNSETEIK